MRSMKNALKPLGKIPLIPLGLIATASTKDTAIHKKMFWSVNMKLIISVKIWITSWKS